MVAIERIAFDQATLKGIFQAHSLKCGDEVGQSLAWHIPQRLAGALAAKATPI
ncbi:hypothetical protein D3C86_2149430 [compost metagenome]